MSTRRQPSAAGLISFGLVATMLLIAVCILIRPAGLAANDGLSYFGIYKTTIVPYTLLFVVSAYVYWQASNRLNSRLAYRRYYSWIIKLMAVAFVGLAATPHIYFDALHVTFGSALFGLQFLFSLVVLYRSRYVWPYSGLGLVELLSGLAALYYLPLHQGFMLQVEIIYQLVFGLLLIQWLKTPRNGHVIRSSR